MCIGSRGDGNYFKVVELTKLFLEKKNKKIYRQIFHPKFFWDSNPALLQEVIRYLS